jgi:hypothetical protein
VARRAPLALTLALAGLALAAVAGASGSTTTGIVSPPPLTLARWNPDTDNLVAAKGTVVVDGKPVAGVKIRVDNFNVPAPTNSAGEFTYDVDATLLQRHVVTVSDASQGKVAGQALGSQQQHALTASKGSVDVAYAVKELTATRNGAGDPVVSGVLRNASGFGPPPVSLLTYQLTGTVTDANGKPVTGAQVSTRTLDRDYWTVSTDTDSAGRYDSLFTASAETPGNPVPFTVRVSKGDVVYQFLPQEFIEFQRLKSATLNIQLPPTGFALAMPRPHSYQGAVYTGVVAGVTSGGANVKPVSVTWPDHAGRFSITLPKSLAGKTVSIWEARLNLFSVDQAVPGGPVYLQDWPVTLPPSVPTDLASITLK